MLDSRVLRVLRKLDEKKCPKPAAELFSINDASPSVVSAALRSARTLGLCDYENLENGGKYWSLTEQGRAAIHESK